MFRVAIKTGMKKLLISLFFIIVASVLASSRYNSVIRQLPTFTSPNAALTPLPESKILEVANSLSVPWSIAFLPDGALLVTERRGNLLKISPEYKNIASINGVLHTAEGGLLGLAVHPQFSSNRYIYLYYTYSDKSGIFNRVERYRLVGDLLSDPKVIIDGIWGSANHDGGQLAFGPDGYLYITTGDAERPNLAQDKNSLNGKILRLAEDGSIPRDNPFGSAIYSYGHRNPQGLAWDDSGRLWSSEHGPSGLQSGHDEINLISKGGNYGWPDIRGDQKMPGMTPPVLESGARDTWAPAGLIHYRGNLFFTGLRGQALYQAQITSGGQLSLIVHHKNQFGRLRAIGLGHDGYIYFSTSNSDGRGLPKPGDDRIIRFDPNSLVLD